MEKMTIQKYNELRLILEKHDGFLSAQIEKYKLLEDALELEEFNYGSFNLMGGIVGLFLSGYLLQMLPLSDEIVMYGVGVCSTLGFAKSADLVRKLNVYHIAKAKEVFLEQYPNDENLLDMTDTDYIHENVYSYYSSFETKKALRNLQRTIKCVYPKIKLNTSNFECLNQQTQELKEMLIQSIPYGEIHLSDDQIIQKIEPVKVKR